MSISSSSPSPKLQFFDNNGNPLVGGKLYTYIAGTTTPQVTYTSASGSSANANPVVLNSRGEADVYLLASAYKFVLRDSADALIWTVDNINQLTATNTLAVADTGSASAPAIKFGSTATGLYGVGNSISLTLNGTGYYTFGNSQASFSAPIAVNLSTTAGLIQANNANYSTTSTNVTYTSFRGRSWGAEDGTNAITVDLDVANNAVRTFKFDYATATTTELTRLTTAGNFKIGGTATRSTTEGTNQLVLFNGTAPVGTLTNGISIYSSAGEAYVKDAAGNATLFSPHDKDTNEWIYYSVHTPTGKTLRIDMERIMRFINDHFGLDAVHEEN